MGLDNADDQPTTTHEREWRGPLKNRNCTDVPCLIIFLLFMLCWFTLGLYALTAGDIGRLRNPTDSRGRKCGVDEGVEDKPLLVYFDIKKCIGEHCDTTQVCRSECPKTTWLFEPAIQPISGIRDSIICEDGINVEDKTADQLAQLIESEVCARWYIPSVPVFNRCIPQAIPDKVGNIDIKLSDLKNATIVIDALAYAQRVVDEAISTWYLVLMFIGACALVCLIYIALLRWVALPCVWMSIIAVIGLLGALTYLFYRFYMDEKKLVYIIFASISGGAAVIIALIAVCLWKKIYIASQLITETAKATSHMVSVMFYPIIPWLLGLSVVIYSFAVFIALMSIEHRQFVVREGTADGSCECSNEIKNTVGSLCEPEKFYKYCHEGDGVCFSRSCHLSDIHVPSYKYYMYALHAVGFAWLYFFIADVKKIIIATAYATWYWTFNKSEIPFFILISSTWRITKYHLGTVAFGSALITICRLFRIVLEYLHRASQKQMTPGLVSARVLNALCCCAKCCMYLLEKLIKFLNGNAYIMCAIKGKGLCSSAASAMSLLMSNIILTAVLNRVITWLLFLGKIAITLGMVLLAYWYFHEHQGNARHELWYVPTILIGFGSYLVANMFFNVYSVGVDTIFLCVLQDCKHNDGSKEKPYYMNMKLGKLFNVA